MKADKEAVSWIGRHREWERNGREKVVRMGKK